MREKFKRLLLLFLPILMLFFNVNLTYGLEQQNQLGQNILKVHFIDTGNSDAILILDNGHNMLIDGAENNDEELMVNYLKNQGVEKIDYVVLTHPDADHCGGLDAVVKNFEIGKIFIGNGSTDTQTYKDFLKSSIGKGLKPSIPLENIVFALGESTFQFYNTKSLAKDVNDRSIVILLKHGENDFLFMGDASSEVEKSLPLDKIGNVEVLKVGHHGSKTSSCEKFISSIKPFCAVICCGKDNKYGHPNQETLDMLNASNTFIFRTDLNGNVIITSDGKNLDTSTQNQANYTDIMKAPNIQNKSDVNNTGISNTNALTKPNRQENISSTADKKQVIVYVTKTGKKYHRDGCSSLKKSKIPMSLEDAKKEGYTPCKKCHPKE